MKTRWMKAVIDNSMQPTPALPFHRAVRLAKRQSFGAAPIVKVARSA